MAIQNGGVYEDVRDSMRMSGLHADPGFWNSTSYQYSLAGAPDLLRTQRGRRSLDAPYYRDSLSGGNTVDGPTPPIFPNGGLYAGWTHEFVTQPVATAFTLSGPIRFNFSSAQTGPAGVLNAGFVARVYKLSTDGNLSLVMSDATSGEIIGGPGITSWSGTPSSTSFAKGDRIALFLGIDDSGGTMSDGSEYGPGQQSVYIYTDGEVAGDVGDSWMQLTENATFDEAINFSGTTLYLGAASSDVSAGSAVDEREMWRTQGNAPLEAMTDTVAGPIAAASRSWTVTPGGNAIEWYSRRLNAFTLSGQVLVAIWGSATWDSQGYYSGAAMTAEVSIVEADGSNPRVWGRQLLGGLGAGSRPLMGGTLSGPDTSITGGQRLRLRIYLDDNYAAWPFPVRPGATASVHYNGMNNDYSTGDNSYIRLSQSVTESTAPPPPPGVPGTSLLDDFNRTNETPVSQGGNWAATGADGRPGVALSQNRIQSFAQPSYSYRVSPYVGGGSEAWATVSVRPNQNHWLSLVICLQGAGSSTWDGYELRAKVTSGPDLWEIRRITDGASTGIGSTTMEIAAGGTMLLRRSAVDLQFWWKPPGGSWTQKLSVGDTTYDWGMIGLGGWSTGALDDFGGGSLLTSLLDQWAPELRLTNDETYRADSAALATDVYWPDPADGHTNFLDRPSIGHVAAADPNPVTPSDDLSLNYLNTSALAGDFLNQPVFYFGDAVLSARTDYLTWTADHPSYKSRTYGRIVPGPFGWKFLQYWFYYYYNPKQWPTGFGIGGNHESDWEWVQVQLDDKNRPLAISGSQHGDGEQCDYTTLVEKAFYGRPVVYVAHESHANYFWHGDHDVEWNTLHSFDITRDDGGQYRQIPGVVDYTSSPPFWIDLWAGRWGDSGGSPETPGSQLAWDDPWGWQSQQAKACTDRPYPAFPSHSTLRSMRMDSQADRANASERIPALPRITSARVVTGTRYGRAIRVSYCYSSLPTDPWRRPRRLHLTVENLNDRLPPLSNGWAVTRRCATVTHPVGPIKPPYLLRYETESVNGTRSKEGKLRVRTGQAG
jgi:hypothetical protein